MSGSALILTILGSGGSPGVPMPACDCAVCSSTEPKNQRTRCSALLSFNGRNVLIDAATDLRQQVLREKIRRIDAVLLTHTHADHIHGIDDLRPFSHHGETPIPLFGSLQTIGQLHRVFPYIFDEGLDEYRPRLTSRVVKGPFQLFGVRIVPIPLVHGRGTSLGYRCGGLAYLTDCSAIPESSLALLEKLDLLVIDGLRFRPHTTHFNIAQAIDTAQRIGATRTLLTHLNHEVDHQLHGGQLPAGIEFAYDGQRIRLTLAPERT